MYRTTHAPVMETDADDEQSVEEYVVEFIEQPHTTWFAEQAGQSDINQCALNNTEINESEFVESAECDGLPLRNGSTHVETITIESDSNDEQVLEYTIEFTAAASETGERVETADEFRNLPTEISDSDADLLQPNVENQNITEVESVVAKNATVETADEFSCELCDTVLSTKLDLMRHIQRCRRNRSRRGRSKHEDIVLCQWNSSTYIRRKPRKKPAEVDKHNSTGRNAHTLRNYTKRMRVPTMPNMSKSNRAVDPSYSKDEPSDKQVKYRRWKYRKCVKCGFIADNSEMQVKHLQTHLDEFKERRTIHRRKVETHKCDDCDGDEIVCSFCPFSTQCLKYMREHVAVHHVEDLREEQAGKTERQLRKAKNTK